MSLDLFAQGDSPERIILDGAELLFYPSINLPFAEADIVAELIAAVPWREEAIVLHGTHYIQPRLIAWYGDPGRVIPIRVSCMYPCPGCLYCQHLKIRLKDCAHRRLTVRWLIIIAMSAIAWACTVTMSGN